MTWFKQLFSRRRLYNDLSGEIKEHLEEKIEELVASGIPRKEATAAARRAFGNVTLIEHDSRAVWRWPSAENLFADIHFALRTLRKNPGFTAVAVLTLALGVGVNTAVFSVLNGWLLRPLPVPDPEQIMILAAQQKNSPASSSFSFPDFLDFQNQAGSFSGLFGYELGVGGFSANGKAHEMAYGAVTDNYFTALRIHPIIGRLLLPGEGNKPGEPLLVVLGYSYWQKNLGGDPGCVGQQVLINGRSATIIGVTPKEFHGTLFAFDLDAYLPLGALKSGPDSVNFWTDRRERELTVLGRLRSDVSISQAQNSLDVVSARLAALHPETDNGVRVRVIPEKFARPAPFVASFVPAIAGLFLLLPALLLVIACVNVANLLLVRAAARQREMAIRSALGAGRFRLISHMLAESLLLAFLGGVTGMLLGNWALRVSGSLLRSVTSTANFAYRLDPHFDWRVFVYTLTTVVLTAILVGLWPALSSSRTDPNATLRSVGGNASVIAGRRGARSILVVMQVAASLMLLIVASLLVRSLRYAEHMDMGFDPDGVLNVMLDPHQIGYDDIRTNNFYRELLNRLRALPGVRSASLSFAVPLMYPGRTGRPYVEGHPLPYPQQPSDISFNLVDSSYFETMRLPLLQGRPFADADNEGAPPVAIVNQTLANRLWPGEDPVGKRFSLNSVSEHFISVVGVARNSQYFFLSPDPQPYFYLPLSQNFTSLRSLHVRSSLPGESLSAVVQEQLRGLDPNMPVIDVRTMRQAVGGLGGMFIFRLAASLAGVLGILGLVLSLVGVYGVVSFVVSLRTHEIGIRMAVGAGSSDILKLISGQGFRLITAGLFLGIVAASLLARAIAKLLIGIAATDPLTYAVVSALLVAVAFSACYLPARHAMRVDPIVALRYE
jgi:macrolide transport system ATP-binding/permease protein